MSRTYPIIAPKANVVVGALSRNPLGELSSMMVTQWKLMGKYHRSESDMYVKFINA